MTDIHLTIDDLSITVPKGTTVYHACRQAGIEIPIFCYQDRMPPFGACRVCLVEVDKMGKLQTSCTLEATEGMVVRTQSGEAVKGREEILELLLINHPLDCPICDKGGECPLQDQALKFGPGQSRFFEEKRHFTKPIPVGPVLMLDRERCIVCARCTRFGDIVAGDHALEMKERGFKTEVGTPNGEPVTSKFIGNTIEICPVGALTSQVYRFRARPWDNEPTPSSCTLCPVGCSMILDSRDGEIMRTRSLENKQINDIWLCDKGWFGYEFTYNPKRLDKPLIRRNGKLEEATLDEALSWIASKIETFRPSGKLAGWGGNPLTTEENFLFQQFIRKGCGTGHVDHRIGMPIFSPSEEGMPPGMEISIEEIDNLSTIYLLGIDLTEEFPVIWLRVKEALNRGTKVHFMGHFAPEIAPYMASIHLHSPGQELETIQKHLPSDASGAIFIGRQYLSGPNRAAILSKLLQLPNISLNLLEGRGNSMGARLAGMYPDAGFDALKVLETAAETEWDFLYVAGANPAKKFPSTLWQKARSRTKFVVVQDLFLTETAQEADVVLPALSYVEKRGSFLNIERRSQKLLPGKEIPEGIYSDGKLFALLGEKLNIPLSLDDAFLALLQEKRLKSPPRPALDTAPIKSSGSLRASFAHALFDEGIRMRANPHVIQLAKTPHVRIHPEEGSERNLFDGDSVLVHSKEGSLTTRVQLDKAVSKGTAVLPLGFSKCPVHDLAANLLNGLEITLEKVAT